MIAFWTTIVAPAWGCSDYFGPDWFETWPQDRMAGIPTNTLLWMTSGGSSLAPVLFDNGGEVVDLVERHVALAASGLAYGDLRVFQPRFGWLSPNSSYSLSAADRTVSFMTGSGPTRERLSAPTAGEHSVFCPDGGNCYENSFVWRVNISVPTNSAHAVLLIIDHSRTEPVAAVDDPLSITSAEGFPVGPVSSVSTSEMNNWWGVVDATGMFSGWVELDTPPDVGTVCYVVDSVEGSASGCASLSVGARGQRLWALVLLLAARTRRDHPHKVAKTPIQAGSRLGMERWR